VLRVKENGQCECLCESHISKRTPQADDIKWPRN